MEVLQVMAECQLRAGMSSLMVRLRAPREPWLPFELPTSPGDEHTAPDHAHHHAVDLATQTVGGFYCLEFLSR